MTELCGDVGEVHADRVLKDQPVVALGPVTRVLEHHQVLACLSSGQAGTYA